jgi:hypothetical protein
VRKSSRENKLEEQFKYYALSEIGKSDKMAAKLPSRIHMRGSKRVLESFDPRRPIDWQLASGNVIFPYQYVRQLQVPLRGHSDRREWE